MKKTAFFILSLFMINMVSMGFNVPTAQAGFGDNLKKIGDGLKKGWNWAKDEARDTFTSPPGDDLKGVAKAFFCSDPTDMCPDPKTVTGEPIEEEEEIPYIDLSNQPNNGNYFLTDEDLVEVTDDQCDPPEPGAAQYYADEERCEGSEAICRFAYGSCLQEHCQRVTGDIQTGWYCSADDMAQCDQLGLRAGVDQGCGMITEMVYQNQPTVTVDFNS